MTRHVSMVLLLGFCLAAGAHTRGEGPAGVSRAAAQAAFERLKQHAGQWEGRSSNGWHGGLTIKEIAGGSAILQESTFSAHAKSNEGMATVIHMDGDRLVLTHYCVAKNQPRLALTRVDSEKNELEFTFLDGGNLPNREAAGHMDRVVLTLTSADRFVSRWTWYQNGAERWLEEIAYKRKP